MELKLPLDVVGRVDVTRILREVKSLEDFFVQAKVRQPGAQMQIPTSSRLLEKVSSDNNYNLLNQPDRQKLADQLTHILDSAPLLHISFASEPSPRFLERILSWFRSNIHPQALLQVGLQPTIAVGCSLRTPNKIFDMSMRDHLKQQENYLVQLINVAANRQKQ